MALGVARDELDALDRDCLYAAAREQRINGWGWRPWRGMYARASRLAKLGLLFESGISAMPPHKLYTITEKGLNAIAGGE